jgi:glutamate-ammonia-ligase adenylyltransferase
MMAISSYYKRLNYQISAMPNPDEFVDLRLFREPGRAQRNLEHIQAHSSANIVKTLVRLAAESPDPDQALNLFERLVSRSTAQTIAWLDQNPTLQHFAIEIFGHSHWLGETLLQRPEILESFHRGKNLERSLGREDYRESFARFSVGAGEKGSVVLARFKKLEYIRIALRDILGVATLAETTEEISALADVIIGEALREAESEIRRRFGRREERDLQGGMRETPFTIVSLGKLGGNELNYSSDVDLLYIYGADEADGALSLREHFIRQAQLVTEILCRSTSEGAVFRIDLRLRPQGNEGEPAIGLQPALHYYKHQAHDWELQALIKARHSAGNPALAREFIRGVQPHVYQENVNFAAIETALDSRQRIGARRRLLGARRQPETVDVKLDRGGIRDIEFLVQCLQRVYGGAEPWLHSRGTLFSLQKLHDKGHLSGKDFHDLSQAYEFLRRVEHRLQLQRGQQIHRLPVGHAELAVLQRAVTGETGVGRTESLLLELKARMARVTEIYERVVHSERRREKTSFAILEPVQQATTREMSLDQVLDRIGADSTELRTMVARSGRSLHARRNMHRFLSSALTSPDRYAALLMNPAAVERATTLFETSDYLTDILVRHPDAIRVLDQAQGDRVIGPSGDREIGTDEASSIAEGSLTSGLPMTRWSDDPISRFSDHPITGSPDALASLRRDFRQRAFAVSAQDVLAPRPAFASLRELTRCGEAAIQRALAIVGGERTLAVFALGRLGTEEFDIASDADLLFVRAPEVDEDHARRDAEKVVQALSAYTREGAIFAVDARLRPRGGAGELVVTPAQVARYLTDEALAWEALTYSKLRLVAGRSDLAPLLLTQVWHQIVEIASKPGFALAVTEMRARLEKSNRYVHSFKQARGGFYDIDFLASCLMLWQASLSQGNTLDRLRHLLELQALEPAAFDALCGATMLYRTTDHVIRLVTGRARPELPEAEHARGAVEKLVNKILGQEPGKDLQVQLNQTAERVRTIFEQVIRR